MLPLRSEWKQIADLHRISSPVDSFSKCYAAGSDSKKEDELCSTRLIKILHLRIQGAGAVGGNSPAGDEKNSEDA